MVSLSVFPQLWKSRPSLNTVVPLHTRNQIRNMGKGAPPVMDNNQKGSSNVIADGEKLLYSQSPLMASSMVYFPKLEHLKSTLIPIFL